MLNIVVKMEEPIKEEQRQRNIKEFFEYKNKQKATEDLSALDENTRIMIRGGVARIRDIANNLLQTRKTMQEGNISDDMMVKRAIKNQSNVKNNLSSIT